MGATVWAMGHMGARTNWRWMFRCYCDSQDAAVTFVLAEHCSVNATWSLQIYVVGLLC